MGKAGVNVEFKRDAVVQSAERDGPLWDVSGRSKSNF